MHRRFHYVLAAAVLVTSACTDNQLPGPERATAPEIAPIRPQAPASLTLPAECSDPALAQQAVNDLLPQVFGPGGGRRGKAQGFSNTIDKARRDADTELAQQYVDSLINYTLQNYYAGNLIGGQSEATQERVTRFIYLLYCANGIQPIPDLSGIFDAENSVLIRNGTPTTVVSDEQHNAAVKIEQGDVPAIVEGEPFFGTLVSVFRTENPLPTSLDWYGFDGYKAGAFEFTTNPEVTFTNPVLTGVCITYDDAIVLSPSDLRLAHEVPANYTPTVSGNYVVTTAGGTIEVLAPEATTPLGLNCTSLTTAAGNVLERALRYFAGLVLPNQVFAAASGGGTGGQAVKFSPFAAVDRVLALSGSAPSSATIEEPATSTTVTATASVETRHPDGLAIEGVRVDFAPTASFNPDFDSTDAAGSASSAWTLVEGVNSGSATPSLASLIFSPASVNYSATAIVLPEITGLTLAFVQQPGKSVCSMPFAGPPSVSVRDQEGNLRPGIAVSLEAVDNNGTPAQLLPATPAITDGSGIATFSGYYLTKTGGYRLVASTTLPTATVRSTKFNVSPPCP